MINKEQLAASTAQSDSIKNIIVEAGAGTGKTKTISERIRFLIDDKNTDPKDILCISFTNKSGQNLKNRLINLMGTDKVKGLFVGTFHSFCSMILKQYKQIFQESSFTIIDSDDQNHLFNICRADFLSSLSDSEIESLGVNEDFDNVIDAKNLASIYSLSRNKQISIEDALDCYSRGVGLPEFIDDISIYEDIISLYEERKKDKKYIDFDDILVLVIEKAKKDNLFKRALSTKFKHLIIDEFQDTNPLQMELVKIILSDKTKGFYVGDPAQTIFSFRGSNNEYISNPKNFFDKTEVFRLSKNYRSRQSILDFANEVLNKSKIHAYNSCLQSDISEKNNKPLLTSFYSETDEANWIVEKINESIKNGTPLSEIMILIRTGFSGRVIEQHLIKSKIPYDFIGGTSLMKTSHVRDLVSLIRIAANSKDDIAWSRCLKLFKGVGDKKSSKIINDISLTEDGSMISNVLYKNLPNEKEFNAFYEGLSYGEQSVSGIVRMAVSVILPIIKLKYDKHEYRVKDLELIAEFSKKYKDILSFIEDLTLDPKTATDISENKSSDRIKLITVHAAKGMESDICFVPKVNPLNYPHARALGNEMDEEEERRIFLVAITRARKELYLTRTLSPEDEQKAISKCRVNHYILDERFNSIEYSD